MVNRLGHWEKRRLDVTDAGKTLVYERLHDPSRFAALMRSAEDVTTRADADLDAPFIVANSMREVQPEINLLVSPDPKRLVYRAPANAPLWQAQATEGADR